jgi:hypothetical protein
MGKDSDKITSESYERSHRQSPRGRGSWAFLHEDYLDEPDDLDHMVWINGTFTEARRELRRRVRDGELPGGDYDAQP